MNTAIEQNVELPGGFASNPVLIKGEGAPVIYLHGPFGQEWDGFLDDLATARQAAHHAVAAAARQTDQRAAVERLARNLLRDAVTRVAVEPIT